MNAGEFGLVVNFDAQYDMSSFSALTLLFTRPDGTVFTVTAPQVTLGTVPITTPLGAFAANQYAQYKIADGDLTLPGMYSARLSYADSTKRLYSSPVRFQVLP